MPNMEIIVGTQLSNVAAQTTLDIQGIVTSMKASGMSNSAIKDTLMADLTGGGRLFGNYRNQVKNTVKTGIGMAGSNASRSTFTKAGVDQFQWVSVGDGKVCPDCEPRHGEVEDLKYWELIGLPQSGFSVCQQNCRCQLVPESYKGENLDKPLIREKKKPLSVTDPKMAGKHKTVQDSIKWAEKNGVIHNQLNEMPLEHVNEINRAISKIPKRYRQNLVIGDFDYFSKVTGRKLKGMELANFGVSANINMMDAKLLTLKEKIALSKKGVGGMYRVVGVNSKGYKSLDEMLKYQKRSNKAYMKRTGNKWSLENYKGKTPHHEFGHIIHNQLPQDMRDNWNIIAKRWANTAGVDMIKIKASWTEAYGEAFAEAWASYIAGDKSLLPDYIIKFMDKV